MLRLFWIAGGWLALGLGLLGIALPLLPTVPFILLAAFCFARGSERMHAWLLGHPRFGPAIRDWREHGAISRTGKRAATVGVLLTFAVSVAVGVSAVVLAIQAVVLTAVLVFVLSRPDRTPVPQPSPAPEEGSSSPRNS